MANLWQLHIQYQDKTTSFCVQREINTREEMDDFIKETMARHPLPEKAMWFIVPEDSPLFLKTKLE